ncbi:MAG: hypothetical protein HYY99_01395 [Candidatus Colwellbacteria bacterium]|nr:hypothetical protein [Candidatus Colwellbacteria bacterium]MBI3088892.1 hypothetical protein [Candidatus Colwellbacteria bacterium]
MQEIADLLGYSLHKVAYWMEKHRVPSRSRSDAMYIKHNPNGDPFLFQPPRTFKEAKLFGMGLGLYWGEGTKSNLNAIRLGNTDPELIKVFIKFLEKFFNIRRRDIKFGLQIFTDINPEEAMDFWIKHLRIGRTQMYKPIITKSGSIGTYKKKSEHGVIMVIYNNTKARKLLGSILPT